MTTLENITNEMTRLEQVISRQQAYIAKFGEQNDLGEYDAQWEQYKEDAEYNLRKWDYLKKERDNLKVGA